jgi:hypothetical protein
VGRGHKGEAEKEAQAREQYLLFKAQTDKLMTELARERSEQPLGQ